MLSSAWFLPTPATPCRQIGHLLAQKSTGTLKATIMSYYHAADMCSNVTLQIRAVKRLDLNQRLNTTS